MRTLLFVAVAAMAASIASSCSAPSIDELLPKGGINCKAEISTPGAVSFATSSESYVHAEIPVPPGAETIEVKVRIFDCKAAK